MKIDLNLKKGIIIVALIEALVIIPGIIYTIFYK